MAVQTKTLQNYIDEQLQYMLAAFPQLNLSPGTVLSGIISAFANVEYELATLLNNSLSNVNVLTATGNALNALANDFGLYRKTGTFASGSLTISLGAPATQIIVGNAGARFSTFSSDLSQIVSYTSTQGYTFSVGQQATTVNVAADLSGSQGNAGVGTITQVLTPLPGVVTVTNGAGLSGGNDIESDASLRQRLLLVLVPVNTLSKVIGAVLGVSGIFMCNAVDNADSKGGFTVVAGDQSGTLAPYLSAVTTAVNANKSLGSNPNIVNPKVTTCNLTYQYAVQPGAVAATVQSALNSAITNFFLNLQLGQVFSPFNLINAIAGANSNIFFVPGLLDFIPLTYSIAVPYQPSNVEVVKLGTLSGNLVSF